MMNLPKVEAVTSVMTLSAIQSFYTRLATAVERSTTLIAMRTKDIMNAYKTGANQRRRRHRSSSGSQMNNNNNNNSRRNSNSFNNGLNKNNKNSNNKMSQRRKNSF